MSKFTGPLMVAYGSDRWAKLLEDLVWELDEEGSQRLVIVPSGFWSDGVSLPWFCWWFMPPWGDAGTRAAILHDYLIEMVHKGTPVGDIDTRAKADRQFYLALLALKVPGWRASLCWFGVRLDGIRSGIFGYVETTPVQ